MSMFQHHYEAFAKLLAEVAPPFSRSSDVHFQYEQTCDAIVELFARDNPKFDRSRFQKAIEKCEALISP